MASLCRLRDEHSAGKDRLLFANPDNLTRAKGEALPGKGRDRKNLTVKLSYDQGRTWPIAKTLEAAQPGIWQALQTRDGWRAMRLNALTPPKPAVFSALRGVVMQDWSDATASEQRTAAVRALAKKYKVVYEPSNPKPSLE